MNINWTQKWNTFIKSFVDQKGYETVLNGLLNTVQIAFFGFIIGVLIGTIIASIQVNKNSKSKTLKFLRGLGNVYVGFFRGTPLVVQLLLGYYLIFPAMGLSVEAVIIAIFIYGLNSGAYVSEIIRSGIQSVDRGQTEAGRSLGFGYTTTMAKIVFPQALKNSLPSLGNEMITIVKETSVAGFITVIDLTEAFKTVGSSKYEFIIPYLVLAAIYLIIVGIMTFVLKLIERRLRKGDYR